MADRMPWDHLDEYCICHHLVVDHNVQDGQSTGCALCECDSPQPDEPNFESYPG